MANLGRSIWLLLRVVAPAKLVAVAVGIPPAFFPARRRRIARPLLEALLTRPPADLLVMAVFLGVERRLRDVPRITGANFIDISADEGLPRARRAMSRGLLLAFVPAPDEFGATVVVLVIIPQQADLAS